jgi:hypothetical protein
MGVACIVVEAGSGLIGEDLPPPRIVTLDHSDLGIGPDTSLGERCEILFSYYRRILPPGWEPDDIVMERQWHGHERPVMGKPGASGRSDRSAPGNWIAVSISLLSLGLLKAMFPSAAVRSVKPIATEERYKDLAHFARKRAIAALGLEELRKVSSEWYDVMKRDPDPIHAIEAYLMAASTCGAR